MKLMNEAPLYVLPTLALILGVDKAILLQKLHECLHLHGTEHGGERWYCQPIYHWHKKLALILLDMCLIGTVQDCMAVLHLQTNMGNGSLSQLLGRSLFW